MTYIFINIFGLTHRTRFYVDRIFGAQNLTLQYMHTIPNFTDAVGFKSLSPEVQNVELFRSLSPEVQNVQISFLNVYLTNEGFHSNFIAYSVSAVLLTKIIQFSGKFGERETGRCSSSEMLEHQTLHTHHCSQKSKVYS
jgi:hypothetical protein